MITLTFAFWMFVGIFAIIGAMRGWAKEILVTFSVILGLFILQLLALFPPLANLFNQPNESLVFWFRTGLILLLVIFGYQTPNIVRMASGKFNKEKFSDALLGFFIGAVNGYLIVGTIWWFMIEANYPLKPAITPPIPIPEIVNYLPPEWLNGLPLYFAIMLSFLFVLIVFI